MKTRLMSGAFNIGSGEPISVRGVLEEVGRQLKTPELLQWGARPIAAWDPPFIVCDSRKLRAETGWRPRYNLHDGLADAIQWQRGQLGLR